MKAFRGNLLSGQVRGPQSTTPLLVKSISIANKSNTLVYINLFIVAGNLEFLISPKDMELQPNEIYLDSDIVVEGNENLLLKSTGNVDYYFSIL
jgi:hypothetical protein